MHGNVWEWIEDVPAASYEGAPSDGSPRRDNPDKTDDRTSRGGSWANRSEFARSAKRNYHDPEVRNYNLGLRAARAYP